MMVSNYRWLQSIKTITAFAFYVVHNMPTLCAIVSICFQLNLIIIIEINVQKKN